jgi:hypothetical protein
MGRGRQRTGTYKESKGVIHYHYYHILKAVTAGSYTGSGVTRAITIRRDNGTQTGKAITISSNNYSDVHLAITIRRNNINHNYEALPYAMT